MEPGPVAITVTPLERGGKLVSWEGGALQIGAYPETIKDTMGGHEGVPDLYLLPESLFDRRAGVSAAELEFPLYYNYYIKQRKLRFICRPHQYRPVLRVLSEALFGPRRVNLEAEYPQGSSSPGFPDMLGEMAWFKRDARLARGRLQLHHVVQPIVLDAEGRVEVDGARITALKGDRYHIEVAGQSEEVELRPMDQDEIAVEVRRTGSSYLEAFDPPDFGVTIIGSGHGFDPTSNTSGFLIWLKGRGVLVDPPVNSVHWLVHRGVRARRIEDLILTHCHADHDSGTLQKVLDGRRMRIYSTPTVMGGFARKYRALTGLTQESFLDLFDFHPLAVDQPVTILGGEFRFKYRLHPIPTLGFEACYGKRSLVYSSDTFYDPEAIRKLQAEGVLSESRAQDLLDFPWHHDLVLHEAGIPPIHTPIAVLAGLPEDVKSRLYLTHLSESSIPAGSGLRLAPPGASHTLILE